MQDISILKLESIKNIITKIPANKLVFWIGAGIDSGKPTSLPLGNGLTDYILQQTCGSKAKKIINIWEKNQKVFNLMIGENFQISNRPRLETIIEAVREFEEHQIRKQSVMEGLCSFSSKELKYNNEHFLLAQYLHKGANIVTTNYGDFICKAYEEKYGEGQIIHEYTDIHMYRANNAWSSCIYHIHGISSDLKTIGANLTTIKNSLPESFAKKFRYWMNNGYVVIFMGYSGFDTLDVNPFLGTFNSDKGGMGIYVRHSDEEYLLPVSEKEEKLLYPFKAKYVCPCITQEFFRVLNGYDKMDSLSFTDEKNDWRDVFSKYAKSYDEELSNAFLSGLCYHLGISAIKLFGTSDWLPKVIQSESIDFWYKHYYSFENAVITNQRKIIKNQGRLLRKKYKSDELMENDFQAARRRISRAINEPHKTTVKEVKRKIKNEQIIDWKISTKLNRYIEYVFFDTIKTNLIFPCNVRIKRKYLKGVIYTKECLQTILQGRYDYVIDVHQISTAYRSLGLCQALLGGHIEDAIDNLSAALNNYIDISSVNGVAMTLIYEALVYLIDYKNNKNFKSLERAEDILFQVYFVIFRCGLKKYYNRYYFTKICWYICANFRA